MCDHDEKHKYLRVRKDRFPHKTYKVCRVCKKLNDMQRVRVYGVSKPRVKPQPLPVFKELARRAWR